MLLPSNSTNTKLNFNNSEKHKMIYHDGSNLNANLMYQECIQANSLFIQGVEALHKGHLFTPLEGYFYTAFFNFSISIERFLKLALIFKSFYFETDVPFADSITNIRHDLVKAYNEFSKNPCDPSKPSIQIMNPKHPNYSLFKFLSNFADKNRYYNLNRILDKNNSLINQPIIKWYEICNDTISRHNVDFNKEEFLSSISKYTTGNSIFNDIKGSKIPNSQLRLQQEIITIAKPYIITQIIEALKPIFLIVKKLNYFSNHKFHERNGNWALPHLSMIFSIFNDFDTIEKNKFWFEKKNRHLPEMYKFYLERKNIFINIIEERLQDAKKDSSSSDEKTSNLNYLQGLIDGLYYSDILNEKEYQTYKSEIQITFIDESFSLKFK